MSFGWNGGARGFAALLAALLLTACVGPDEDAVPHLAGEAATAGWRTARAESVGLDPERLRRFSGGIGALGYVRALLVARNGCLVAEHYRKGHGQGTPQPLLSISKSVLSAVLGVALRDGLVRDLDQPVGALLPPELAAHLAGDDPPITLRHLVTMSSGLISSEIDLNHLVWRAMPDPLLAVLGEDRIYPAGEIFRYGTSNAHVIGAALAHLSRRPLSQYAREALLGPAGIVVSAWEKDDAGRDFGGIGLSMTPRHLARFAQLYVAEGRLGGRQILPAAWIAESMQPRFETVPRDLYGDYQYGYFWWLRRLGRHRVLVARGFAGQAVHAIPAHDLIVVTSSDWFVPDEIATPRVRKLLGLIEGYLTDALGQLDSNPAGGRCPI